MYTAEDLFTEDDLIQIDDNNQNSGNEQQENENGLGDEQEQNEPNEDDGEERKVVKPKRVVRNPQPKLNVQTLQGPKGLVCLEEHFKNKKYKGRGHEQEDLRTVMKTYEYWCHRLFPKLPFDDCLAKIESLGNKKPMQTYLKRIRMGLIFDQENPIQSDNDDNEENQANDNQAAFDELVTQDVNVIAQTPQDHDQQLTEEQLERIRLNKERADRLRREKLERHKQALAAASQTVDSAVELEETEEQLERIRVNREKAERLRQERLKRNKPHTSNFMFEGTHDSSENAGFECEGSNVEVGSSNMNADGAELSNNAMHILDSVEEDIRNDEETEEGLNELENADVIKKNIQVDVVGRDQEPSNSKITDEIVQSGRENEEAVSMDCSS